MSARAATRSSLARAPSRASSTLRAPARLGGVPEVSSGIPSPPLSPLLAGKRSSNKHIVGRFRPGAAAQTITASCERLCCEILRSVFLGEEEQYRKDSLVMGVHCDNNDYGVKPDGHPARFMDSPEPELLGADSGLVSNWIEMFDYTSGFTFSGFVAEKDDEKAMFVFFDQSVVAGDLKAGLMALLELCEVDHFSCDRLVVCIDRHADQLARDTLVKDLGWIGFSLATLDDFSDGAELTSEQWLFMDMET